MLFLASRRDQGGAMPRRIEIERRVSSTMVSLFTYQAFSFTRTPIPLTISMIPLLSGRLLPHPRAVAAAAERGGGRAGFSGRSGSSSKRGGGRGGGGGGSKSGRGGGGSGRGGGGGRGKTDGNIGTQSAAPKKIISNVADPPEVSNEPSLLSAPMEVSLSGGKRGFWGGRARERAS